MCPFILNFPVFIGTILIGILYVIGLIAVGSRNIGIT